MSASSFDLHTLGSRFDLPDGALVRLEALARLLSDDPLAPTSIREPRKVLEDHLADSLVALDLAGVRAARAVVDIGSGAGLPGLPLAIALPTADLVLLESSARKCRFLERAVEVCGLANVEVVQSRSEEWRAGSGRFELALVRALAGMDVVLEYSAPLLRLGGAALLWRGRRDTGADAEADRAASVLGLSPPEVSRVQPYPQARDRYLYLFSKVRETPTGFPRRSGMATKRPLGRR